MNPSFPCWFTLLLSCAVVSARLTPEQVKALPPSTQAPVDFAHDIQPILEASCVKCHARGKVKGGLNLETREHLLKGGDSGAAVVVGKSAESYLIELVSGLDPDNVMPDKGSKLTAEQVSLLRAWIDQGLKWDASITFAKQPSRNLHPVAVSLPAGKGHPLDRLMDGYFTKHGVLAGVPVSDRVFARRVHLDLVGLLPRPEALEKFVADTSPQKREKLVDVLLKERRLYAEHWLTFWNDLLRNDYRGAGYIDGGRKQISKWLFGALYENMPYDNFVSRLVNPDAASEGFIKGIVWRGAVNASQTPEMQAAQNISQVFMGVNLKCASCHDSFINDWSLADAYGMATIFAEGPLEMFRCDKPTGQKVTSRFLYSELGEIKATASKAERQKQLAEILTGPKNGRFTRTMVNRLWSTFMGRGLVEPLDDMEQAAWNEDVLNWLAEDLAAHKFDLKRTMKLIVTSRAYQLPAVSRGETEATPYVFRGPSIRRLSAEQFIDALSSVTGVWHEAPATTFEVPAVTDDLKLPATHAKWIWNQAGAASNAPPERVNFRRLLQLPEKPISAFVAVSCDNAFTLYVNGTKAGSGKDFAKPVLVDLSALLKEGTNVIAVEAVNVTRTLAEPVSGKTYGPEEASPAGFILSGHVTLDSRVLPLATDGTWTVVPEAKEGWRTDWALVPGEKLADELGEANLAPWSLEEKLAQTSALAVMHSQVRASLVPANPLMTALGRPAREQVLTTRASAATTLQALELTNGRTLSKLLESGVDKLLAVKKTDTQASIVTVFRRALGRAPSLAELAMAQELLQAQGPRDGLEDLLWSVAMLPEFQLIY